jgi:hypothetical protein
MDAPTNNIVNMQNLPACADFEANLNTAFSVKLGDSVETSVQLISVTKSVPSPTFESFSLLFTGAKDGELEQNVYDVSHNALGDFALFLVPVGRDAEGCKYEAVFNNLIS